MVGRAQDLAERGYDIAKQGFDTATERFDDLGASASNAPYFRWRRVSRRLLCRENLFLIRFGLATL